MTTTGSTLPHNSPPLAGLSLPVELTRPVRRRRWPWLLLALSGGLIVLAEILWLTQDAWLRQPAMRMALAPLLERTGHELRRPLIADAWQATALSLRAEAASDGVWHVDALLTNRADILQPWPRLELSLRDWQGQLIGRRLLAPRDYLPSSLPTALGPQALIASDQPVQISVAVRIPARADGSVPVFEQAELRPQP